MDQIQRACPGQDIISELPEAIRFHILTLLPRKYAIRTGVLSSKWKDVWKKRFPHPSNLTFGRSTHSDEQQKQLAEEIQQCMNLHGNKRIETFTLYFYPGRSHEKMTAGWLEQAAANETEEFLLDFSQAGMGSYPRKQLARRAKKFELRENLLKCQHAVTSLTLSYCRLQRYFKFRYFSCLETLCLRRVNINDFMFGRLVINCRRLETIELTRCYYVKHIKIHASLNRLKRLTIAYCSATKEINLSAPMLHTFHFFGDYPRSFFLLNNMPFLRDVILMSPIRHQWLGFHRGPRSSVAMWLDHVQVITLCNMGLSAMYEMRPPTLINFDHLKELQLLMKLMIYRDISNLFRFFRYCPLPLLERLYVELPDSYPANDVRDESQPIQEPPTITFQHLKMIKMNNFKGTVNELMLLKFLLRSASNLKLIILVFHHQFYTDATDMQRVNVFNSVMLMRELAPRAQILLYYSYQNGISAAQSNTVQGFQDLQAEIYKNGV